MNKRKARKRKCRRLPTWGSMRCKVNFPTSCQLLYHLDCLLYDYKDASSFFELPVVVSVFSIFPYLNKQNIKREEKEKGVRRRGGRENEKDIIHVLYTFIHCWSVEQCSFSCECIRCWRGTLHWCHGIHEPPLPSYLTRQWYSQWVTQPVQ